VGGCSCPLGTSATAPRHTRGRVGERTVSPSRALRRRRSRHAAAGDGDARAYGGMISQRPVVPQPPRRPPPPAPPDDQPPATPSPPHTPGPATTPPRLRRPCVAGAWSAHTSPPPAHASHEQPSLCRGEKLPAACASDGLVPVLLPAPALGLPVRRLMTIAIPVSSLWRLLPQARLRDAPTKPAPREQHSGRGQCTHATYALCARRIRYGSAGCVAVSRMSRTSSPGGSLCTASTRHSRDGPCVWSLWTLAHDSGSRRFVDVCLSVVARAPVQRLHGGTWLHSHCAMPPQPRPCMRTRLQLLGAYAHPQQEYEGRGGVRSVAHRAGGAAGLCGAGARRCRRWRMTRAAVTPWSGPSPSGCAALPTLTESESEPQLLFHAGCPQRKTH
jgi:hypothetical protein